MLKIILAVAVIIIISFSIIPAHAIGFDNSLERLVIEKQKEYPSWYVGKDVLPQQNYTYHICDYSIKPTLNYATPCYQAELDFIDLLQEQAGQTWIVQAIFTPDDTGKQWFSILHISQDFATITTDGVSMNYVTSLSHTIFYLQKYANMHKPQLLKIGTSWGLVDEYVSPVPQFTVNRFTTIPMGDITTSAYQVGFEVVQDNTFYIKDNIPFPIESTLYDSNTANTDAPAIYQVKLLSSLMRQKTLLLCKPAATILNLSSQSSNFQSNHRHRHYQMIPTILTQTRLCQTLKTTLHKIHSKTILEIWIKIIQMKLTLPQKVRYSRHSRDWVEILL